MFSGFYLMFPSPTLFHYRPQTTRLCDSKTFRLQLAKSLIGDYNSRKTRGRPSSSADRNPVSTPI